MIQDDIDDVETREAGAEQGDDDDKISSSQQQFEELIIDEEDIDFDEHNDDDTEEVSKAGEQGGNVKTKKKVVIKKRKIIKKIHKKKRQNHEEQHQPAEDSSSSSSSLDTENELAWILRQYLEQIATYSVSSKVKNPGNNHDASGGGGGIVWEKMGNFLTVYKGGVFDPRIITNNESAAAQASVLPSDIPILLVSEIPSVVSPGSSDDLLLVAILQILGRAMINPKQQQVELCTAFAVCFIDDVLQK